MLQCDELVPVFFILLFFPLLFFLFLSGPPFTGTAPRSANFQRAHGHISLCLPYIHFFSANVPLSCGSLINPETFAFSALSIQARAFTRIVQAFVRYKYIYIYTCDRGLRGFECAAQCVGWLDCYLHVPIWCGGVRECMKVIALKILDTVNCRDDKIAPCGPVVVQ